MRSQKLATRSVVLLHVYLVLSVIACYEYSTNTLWILYSTNTLLPWRTPVFFEASSILIEKVSFSASVSDPAHTQLSCSLAWCSVIRQFLLWAAVLLYMLGYNRVYGPEGKSAHDCVASWFGQFILSGKSLIPVSDLKTGCFMWRIWNIEYMALGCCRACSRGERCKC